MDEAPRSREQPSTDRWWEAFAPLHSSDYLNRLMGLSHSYAELAQRLAGADDTNTAVARWLSDLENLWRPAEGGVAGAEGDSDLGHAEAIWALPLDAWEQAAASLMPSGGDFLRGVKEGSHRAGHRLDAFLSMPGVGYTRETQEQHQRYLRLLLRYMATLSEYQSALAGVGLRSIDAFRARLSEAPTDESVITSIRALYDHWVDTFEAEYVQFAKSAEHSALYGRLINALTAVKLEAAAITEQMVGALNLPTQREVDTMQRYIHDIRRELRVLKNERVTDRKPPVRRQASTRGRRKPKHH